MIWSGLLKRTCVWLSEELEHRFGYEYTVLELNGFTWIAGDDVFVLEIRVSGNFVFINELPLLYNLVYKILIQKLNYSDIEGFMRFGMVNRDVAEIPDANVSIRPIRQAKESRINSLQNVSCRD